MEFESITQNAEDPLGIDEILECQVQFLNKTQEEIRNEEIRIIAGVSVGVGGDRVVARRSLPSSSSFRFRETRCWRLRWIGLHRRFFRHPGRRVRPRLRSFDNKVRKAG
jgi:hypothetical protein